MTIQAREAIQCRDQNSEIGDFLFSGDLKGEFTQHSPTFKHLNELFDWIKANNWKKISTNNPYLPIYEKTS